MRGLRGTDDGLRVLNFDRKLIAGNGSHLAMEVITVSRAPAAGKSSAEITDPKRSGTAEAAPPTGIVGPAKSFKKKLNRVRPISRLAWPKRDCHSNDTVPLELGVISGTGTVNKRALRARCAFRAVSGCIGAAPYPSQLVARLLMWLTSWWAVNS